VCTKLTLGIEQEPKVCDLRQVGATFRDKTDPYFIRRQRRPFPSAVWKTKKAADEANKKPLKALNRGRSFRVLSQGGPS
jgi:hypothetical protein